MLTDAQRTALTARLRRGRDASPAAIPRRQAGQADLPLSFAQEQLWFLDKLAPGQPAYNLPQALRLSGQLDRPALTAAISGLIARHETLRTRFVTGRHGDPVQQIDPPATLPVPLTDLTSLAPSRQRARLRELIDAESIRPFSLASGPLWRVVLIRLASEDHVLLAIFHHTIFDGWSAGLLVRQLAALYGQEAGGAPAGLAELPIQFADYALWERGRLHGPVLAGLESYWRGALAGFPTVRFPADRPRPVLDDQAGGLAEHLTDRDLLDRLRALSHERGTTLFVTLLAGLQALLFRYTGQTDLVVGTVSANRGRPELTPLIGFLVNTLPIRADLSGDPPFAELLDRVRQATTSAYAHQDLPFAQIVATLSSQAPAARVERDPSRTPLFQIALTCADRDPVPVRAAGVDFALTDLVVGISAAKFDLDFSAEARPGGLWIECSYKTALFNPEKVRRLLAHLEVLLRGAVTNPFARLSELPLLTVPELHAELVERNDSSRPYPRLCVHEGFARQAALTPDAIACEFGADRVSYAELARRAGLIARRLRTAGTGVGPEVLTGVCMRSGPLRLAALLGIWMAGSGYVPLDPALPRDRLTFMIADTSMTVIVTDEPSAASLPESGARVLILDGAEPGDAAGVPLDSGVTPANAAYVIYTSGSTGRPKGVVVEHRQAASHLYGMIEAFGVGAGRFCAAVRVAELRRVGAGTFHAAAGRRAGRDGPARGAAHPAPADRAAQGPGDHVRLPDSLGAQPARAAATRPPAGADVRRRGTAVGAGEQVAAARTDVRQRLRSYRDHGDRRLRTAQHRDAIAAADRLAGPELPRIRARSAPECSAGRGDRGAVCRRGWCGSRLSRAAGTDR